MIDTPGTDAPGEAWSFTTAREPAEFPAVEVEVEVEVEGVPGVEHAGGTGRTLCGIRGRHLKLLLHRFRPRAPASCRKCRVPAEAAPSRPCGQERLHDLLLQEADDGPLRTDLLAALRGGARIAIWITGPAASLTRHHARLDRMTEETGSTSSSCRPTAAPASREGWRLRLQGLTACPAIPAGRTTPGILPRLRLGRMPAERTAWNGCAVAS